VPSKVRRAGHPPSRSAGIVGKVAPAPREYDWPSASRRSFLDAQQRQSVPRSCARKTSRRWESNRLSRIINRWNSPREGTDHYQLCDGRLGPRNEMFIGDSERGDTGAPVRELRANRALSGSAPALPYPVPWARFEHCQSSKTPEGCTRKTWHGNFPSKKTRQHRDHGPQSTRASTTTPRRDPLSTPRPPGCTRSRGARRPAVDGPLVPGTRSGPSRFTSRPRPTAQWRDVPDPQSSDNPCHVDFTV